MIKDKFCLFKILIAIVLVFAINVRVKADNRIVSSFPSSITADYNGIITQDGVNIYSKGFNDTGRAFCTLFWNDFKTGTCNATWWSQNATENKKIAVAVGAMINKARSLSGGSGSIDTDVYFYTEMAINYFLYNYNGKHSENNVSTLRNWSNVSSRATYKAIYADGTAAYNNFGKSRAIFSGAKIEKDPENNKITFSAKLTCYNEKGTKIRCAARCRDTLKYKLTYADGSTEGNNSTWNDVDSCNFNSSDTSYTYKKSFNLATDKVLEKAEFSLDTNNYTSYPVAQEYYCGSSDYQNLTPNMIKTLNVPYNVNIKGSKTFDTTIPKCNISLAKHAGSIESATMLSGAEFELRDSQGNLVEKGTTDDDGMVTFSDLDPGNYTYKEVKAPKGYVLDTTSHSVSCSASGNTTEEVTVDVPNTPVVGKGSLTIKKEDGNGNAVAGAKIKVYKLFINSGSGSSNDMSGIGGYLGTYDEDYTILDSNLNNYELIDEFITTTTPKVITGLDLDYVYYVEEESVPEGSDYAMKISSDIVNVVEAINYEVTLINIHSNFKISKQDITTKKELPGAEIIITDIYGNKIESWTSTDTPHEIRGLADGEYILTEITAPKGYKKAESIRFVIENGQLKDDDGDNTLVMYDDAHNVIVPDTLSGRNILIILSGMVIVAAGIGVFLYGVKRKDEI